MGSKFDHVWNRTIGTSFEMALRKGEFDLFIKRFQKLDRVEQWEIVGWVSNTPRELAEGLYYHAPDQWVSQEVYVNRMICYAWEIRGSGYASETSRRDLHDHHHILSRLMTLAQDSYAAHPHISMAHALLVLHMATVRDIEQTFAMFSGFMHHHPGDWRLVGQMVSQVSNSKWSGLSEDAWLEYAFGLLDQYLNSHPICVLALFQLLNELYTLYDWTDDDMRAHRGLVDPCVAALERAPSLHHIERVILGNCMSVYYYLCDDFKAARRVLDHFADGKIVANPWYHYAADSAEARRILKKPWWQFWG